MKSMIAGAALALLASAAFAADPAPGITRTPIATFTITPAKSVTQVQTFHSVVAPGAAAPPHYHPAPVICFAEKGSFAYKIGDAPEGKVMEGGATLEPANTPIHYFRNMSATEPAVLLCAFLAGPDDKTLAVPLKQ
jgi:quercetin dioxygenase-like cupin family protein